MTDEVKTTETEGGTSEENVAGLHDLVGPDKKFKTVDDLVRGKLEADAFIEKLKEENEEARQELSKLSEKATSEATIKDLMKLIKTQNSAEEEGNQSISEEELSKKVLEIIRGDELKRTAETNRERGERLVLEKVGGDVEAAEQLKTMRAKELGISKETLASLSEESPAAFAKIMGIEEPNRTVSQSPTALQGINNESMPSGPQLEIDGHKTNAWYDQKRKELGTAKYLADKKIQIGILRDRTALGDRFYQNK